MIHALENKIQEIKDMEEIEIESTLNKLKEVMDMAHNDNIQEINNALGIKDTLPEEEAQEAYEKKVYDFFKNFATENPDEAAAQLEASSKEL